MTVLPIVERELRIASRRRGTYWARIIAAVIAIGVAAIILLTDSPRMTSEQLGKNIFGTLAWFAFLYCLFIGARNTADCISEERREGTLGLLFLTDLKGFDVVIGKMVASSLNSVYGFVAIFPVLALPILLGGTPEERVGLVAIILSNTLFMSLAVGMWVSTISKAERSTMLFSLILVVFITVGLPILGILVDRFLFKGMHWDIERLFFLPSPGYALMFSFENWTGRQIPPTIWYSILSTHILSWGLLALAFYRLPRSWQDKTASAKQLHWRQRWREWSHGVAEERRVFRTRLMEANPFYWLAARDRLKPAYVWAMLGLLGCLWFWGWIEMKSEWLDEGTYFMTGFIVFSILKWWLASEACMRLSEDRRSGALELLLSTPLQVEDILRGQMLALRRQFFGPSAAAVAMVFLFMIAERGNEGWTTLCAAGAVLFIADMYTLSWLGMWQGLRARATMRAMGSVVLRILFGPWIVLVLIIVFAAVTRARFLPTLGESTLIGLWFGLGMVNNLVHFLWARQGLLEEFRAIATQRYDGLKVASEDSVAKAPVAAAKAAA